MSQRRNDEAMVCNALMGNKGTMYFRTMHHTFAAMETHSRTRARSRGGSLAIDGRSMCCESPNQFHRSTDRTDTL